MPRTLPWLLGSALAAQLALGGGQAQDKKDEKKVEKKAQKELPKPSIAPTAANVSYGPHPRNVLDFWQAKSEKPARL